MRWKSLSKNIIVDPDVAHGKPTFKGTRVMVWQVLELLAAGESKEDIYRAYPSLPKGAVEEALRYVAEKAKGLSYVYFEKQGAKSKIST